PAELLDVDDHLAECAECRRLIESELNDDVAGLYAYLTAETGAGPHLTFDQSAAYIDGLLTGEERRMIEDHLASCALCAPLTEDLRAFRTEIAPELDREYSPQKFAERHPKAPWRNRAAAAMRALLPKIPSWIYAAPVLLLVAVAVWLIATSQR